jgi:20S proteasome alpha/beta subunit
MTTHITKTWFDGEKVVTQEIPEADFYKPSMTKDEALKLALEALEHARYGGYDKQELNKAITAIKEALAQPEDVIDPNQWAFDNGLEST